jgi:hypothetical protein
MAAALGTSCCFWRAHSRPPSCIGRLGGAVGVCDKNACGLPWGIASFAATALLSSIGSAEAVSILYALFLGYYPVIKSSLERFSSKVLRWTLKLLLFNAALALLAALGRAVFTLGLPADSRLLPALLLGANAVFVVYDLALTQLILFYLRRLGGKIQ